jgi:hypothetical protein
MSFAPEQEEESVDGRHLALIAAVSVAIAIVATLASIVLERATTTGARSYSDVPQPPPLGTVERTLVAEEPGRGVATREQQREELARFGWADRDAGVAYIPIDRAIDLWLAREQERRP